MVAAREGGGDPSANATLRLAIAKAKAAHMPKDKIEYAVQKGLGGSRANDNFQEISYEGYGPYGVAVFIKALTDNKNRTVADIRSLFSKYGGSLATSGSTDYIFSPDPSKPNIVQCIASDGLQQMTQLVGALEEHSDVLEVFTNLEVSAGR